MKTAKNTLIVLFVALICSNLAFAIEIVKNQSLPEFQAKVGRQVILTEVLRIADESEDA